MRSKLRSLAPNTTKPSSAWTEAKWTCTRAADISPISRTSKCAACFSIARFTSALPPKLQDAVKRLNLNDPIKVKTRAVIYQAPEQGKTAGRLLGWQAWMYDAKLTAGLDLTHVTGTLASIGRYNGRQIVGIDGNLLFDQSDALWPTVQERSRQVSGE